MVAVIEDADQQIPPEVRPKVINEFRKHSGSVLGGFFGAAAFDEVALVPVAAAVDKTGRFEANFADRGVRSGFSTFLAIWGDAADRAAEGERLKTLHRDVHGRGKGEFADVRYSALDPRLWNWIAVSGLMLVLNSFTPCTGVTLTDDERDVAYQQLLESFRALELPGKSAKLPARYADAGEYYDAMVDGELAANPFLRRVTENLTRLPLPTLVLPPALRLALTPPWLVLRPLAGRVVKVCSFGILHPGVRDLTGFDWRSRHDREFALYTRLLQLAWRTLPDRVLLIPLARNRIEYEKLVRLHRSVGLESFAPPAGSCPVG
ncbi:oxygenase MpaB family protein [Mycolicibacterium hippocampi]|uniref:oxygenase MpaB family protein n=1 Tax=Mycolicibacterium hippocampi TaxID=659824 RepID=UPI0035173C3B